MVQKVPVDFLVVNYLKTYERIDKDFLHHTVALLYYKMPTTLLYFAWFCTVTIGNESLAAGAVSLDSIFSLTPNVQQEHLWCFWNRAEQRRIRCLSTTCRRLHDELLSEHYWRETSMHQLYLSIPDLKGNEESRKVLFHDFYPVQIIRDVSPLDVPHYIIMVEKILCKLMENGTALHQDWEAASNLCNRLMSLLGVNVSLYPRIKVMRSMCCFN